MNGKPNGGTAERAPALPVLEAQRESLGHGAGASEERYGEGRVRPGVCRAPARGSDRGAGRDYPPAPAQ